MQVLAVLGAVWSYTLWSTLVLFGVQLLWQIGRSEDSKDLSSDPSSSEDQRASLGVPYIRTMTHILGLTGDNSPKKRIVLHDVWLSYLFVLFSHFLALEWFGWDLTSHSLMNHLAYLALAVLFVVAMRLSNTFLLLKVYSEAGLGFNFYYKGFRIIGFDYHAWQIRQDPVTGKPLPRDKQYWSRARPHIDIPSWNLHHWPFDQFEDAETLKTLMNEKSAQRADKHARKEEKRKRREEKLQNKSKDKAVRSQDQDEKADQLSDRASDVKIEAVNSKSDAASSHDDAFDRPEETINSLANINSLAVSAINYAQDKNGLRKREQAPASDIDDLASTSLFS